MFVASFSMGDVEHLLIADEHADASSLNPGNSVVSVEKFNLTAEKVWDT